MLALIVGPDARALGDDEINSVTLAAEMTR